jgi:hypothetical protein
MLSHKYVRNLQIVRQNALKFKLIFEKFKDVVSVVHANLKWVGKVSDGTASSGQGINCMGTGSANGGERGTAMTIC